MGSAADQTRARPRSRGRKPLRQSLSGPYTLQAGIAACHARADSVESTDWARIVSLYDALRQLWDSPVVDLDRAVAVGMSEGPAAGLAAARGRCERPAPCATIPTCIWFLARCCRDWGAVTRRGRRSTGRPNSRTTSSSVRCSVAVPTNKGESGSRMRCAGNGGLRPSRRKATRAELGFRPAFGGGAKSSGPKIFTTSDTPSQPGTCSWWKLMKREGPLHSLLLRPDVVDRVADQFLGFGEGTVRDAQVPAAQLDSRAGGARREASVVNHGAGLGGCSPQAP